MVSNRGRRPGSSRAGSAPAAAHRFLALVVVSLLAVGSSPPTVASSDPTQQVSGEHEEIRRLLTATNYPAAESRARALVASLEGTRPQSLELAQALDLLVQSLVEGGKPSDPSALPGAQRAVALKGEILGPDDAGLAISLSNLGLVLRRQGKLDDARVAYERALRIREKTLGSGHPEVARALAALSALASNAGNFPQARELGERAVAIAERAEPRDRVVEAVTANNLALALFQLGDFAGARQRLEQALQAYESALGADHPEVGKTLSNLANIVSESGDLAEARRMYERAIAIQEKRQGKEHPDVALNLNNLAEIFFLVGDFETSAGLFERVVTVLERAFGPQHTRVALALGNLAQVRAAQGRLQDSRGLYVRALAIREKAVGPEHPSLVYTLTGFAELHARLGEHAAAAGMFERALAISERAFGADHPVTALALQGLGDLRLAEGKAADAEIALERALRIRSGLLGDEHPLVAESRASLALAFARTGRAQAALEAALEAERVARAHLQITAQALAERQALTYAEHRVSGADVALSLLASHAVTGDAGVRRTWDAVVRSRALVLEEMAWRQRLAAATSDPALSKLAGDLAAARQRLAGLLVRSAADPASREAIERAVRERDAAERALAERSLEFRSEQARVRTGLREAAAGLPAATALVAYVRFQRSSLDASPPRSAAPPRLAEPRDEYVAFVARTTDETPLAIPLGPARAIDDRINRWRAAIASELEAGRPTQRSERLHRELGAGVRRLLWDPVSASVAGIKQVFIVPAGPLHLVSWGALPDRAGGYLVEAPQLLHYLSSERDLTRHQTAGGQGLLLIDNPAYGPQRTAGKATARGAAGGVQCGGLQALNFDPLPGTRREGHAIAALWRSMASPPDDSASAAALERLTDASATEAHVRDRVRGRRVVHFATHGFFLGAWCAPAAARASSQPLLLAGLALAGANRRESQAPLNDGVLLAEEIATLDLHGVEWAVLSACDTGAGVIAAGEELFGLRRSFQVAGASTVIVSLWPVDDETTRGWMDTVYKARFVERATTPAAVRAATAKTLAARRARGDSTHPAYWAAFVATGGGT